MNDYTIVTNIINNKKLSNARKSMAFREIAFQALEHKDYNKAIEFIEHAKDFSEFEQHTQVLDMDLERIYFEQRRLGCEDVALEESRACLD
jgi:hypothetical protein